MKVKNPVKVLSKPTNEEMVLELIKKYETDFKSIRNKYDKILAETRAITKANNQIFNKFYKFASAHEKYLQEIARKMSDVDETMGNVLMAIRQNEFLQAHYPEQHGFSAMNVIGKHPAKLMKAKPLNFDD